MNLIAYSDSESETEAPPAPKPIAKPAAKPAFQKVVDRSNPGRIKVNLPSASQAPTEKDDIETEARPAKKPRIGAGAFSGFNAMLPAPKKPNVSTTETAQGKRGLGKGLGSGVNLKTGAEPAFQRSSRVELEEYDENGNPVKKEALKKEDFRAMLNLPPPKTEAKENEKDSTARPPETTTVVPEKEVKLVSAPKFVPMSVGRGKKKKKPVVLRAAAAGVLDDKLIPTPQPPAAAQKPAARPKVSLFGVAQATEVSSAAQSNGEYQPLLYGAEGEDDTSVPDAAFQHQSAYNTTQYPSTVSNVGASNDLTNIASELNLSKAEQRQLLGRKGQGLDPSSARIVNFNTDTEYAHNEMLRQQGETVQHNPLKSISGTGKNSLRSLVNVAQTQKDALEEHLATGRRNKKEAGNRYGW